MDIRKLAPMAHEVIASLPCSRSTSITEHEVDTRSGIATCVPCGASQEVDAEDLRALLVDA